jgi:hypothetical protein
MRRRARGCSAGPPQRAGSAQYDGKRSAGAAPLPLPARDTATTGVRAGRRRRDRQPEAGARADQRARVMRADDLRRLDQTRAAVFRLGLPFG